MSDQDALFILQNYYYLHEHSRMGRERFFINNGKVEMRRLTSRIYSYRELLDLFQQVGFTVSATYDLLSHNPFQLGSLRLNVVAVKPE